MRSAMVTILIILTILDLNEALAASNNDRESLRGLPGVQVVIEDIARDAQADGLREDHVRTAVELIFRSSGIRLLTESQRYETPSAAWLYVDISTFKNTAGVYAFAIKVSLRQLASLVDRPERTMFVTTWENEAIGTSGAPNIVKIISHLETLIKEFANDFLTVNPR